MRSGLSAARIGIPAERYATMINRKKLRDRVRAEFGPDLERVSPAGVRDFLDRLYRDIHRAKHPDGAIEIDETARSYDQVMAEFFSRALDASAEDAAVMLWLWAFEQHFTAMQEEYAQRFVALFERTWTIPDDAGAID